MLRIEKDELCSRLYLTFRFIRQEVDVIRVQLSTSTPSTIHIYRSTPGDDFMACLRICYSRQRFHLLFATKNIKAVVVLALVLSTVLRLFLFLQKDNLKNVKQEMVKKKCSTFEDDTMYTYGNEIYDVIGETELQQYQHFKKYNPHFRLAINHDATVVKLPAGYHYHVKALSSTDIVIEERDGNAPSLGGSSFIVRSESISSQICHYDDFFNGTYVAHCPLPACTCRNISVWLMYFNFTAYTGNHIPIKKLLWQHRSCNPKHKDSGLSLRHSASNTNAVTWYLKKTLWVATSPNGADYVEMTKSAICSCIKNIRKLFCIGASHTRFKCDYYMHMCYNIPPHIPTQHLSLSVENIHYLTVNKVFQFPNLWENYLKNETLDRHDVVIIQTGAHDMAHIGIQHTMNVLMDLVNVLSGIQKKSVKYGFKLVYVTTPPFPENDKRQSKGSRNNFALAAVNRKLKSELLLRNVNVFDEFSVLLAQQDNNRCGCHYVCRVITNNMTSVIGNVGITAANMLLSNEIC